MGKKPLYERGYCKAMAVIIRDVEKSCTNNRLLKGKKHDFWI